MKYVLLLLALLSMLASYGFYLWRSWVLDPAFAMSSLIMVIVMMVAKWVVDELT